MGENSEMYAPSTRRVVWVGLLVGFLLNLTGWLGNNFLLGAFWDDVGASLATIPWRSSIWRNVISFVPDYGYGIAIAWLVVAIRPRFHSYSSTAISAGLFVALVGGIITYLAIANSGFIPWSLAFASFALVLGTKLPLAFLAAHLLEPKSGHP